MTPAELTILKFCGDSVARVLKDFWDDVSGNYNERKYETAINAVIDKCKADNKALRDLSRTIVKIQRSQDPILKEKLPELYRIFNETLNS